MALCSCGRADLHAYAVAARIRIDLCRQEHGCQLDLHLMSPLTYRTEQIIYVQRVDH